jgi:IclR family acetate operon transcriptional repressor
VNERSTAEKTDTVGKALWVLQAMGNHPQGVQLAELAREGRFPLSTAHRLAMSLVREGFATFDESTRRYHLGLKLFALAARVSNAHGFAGAALPVLRDLAATTQEAALMSVLEGHHQLYVHYIKGPQQVNVIGEPGRLGPLHNTSMGKVLVAFAPDHVREELVANLPLEPTGPNTITQREKFAEEIAMVRKNGYALADEEHETGIHAVGVPVLGPDGTALAAISIASPSFRMSIEDCISIVPELTAAARKLTVLLPPRDVATS